MATDPQPTTQPSAGRRAWRVLKAAIVGMAIMVAAALVVLILLTQTQPGRDMIRDAAVPWVNQHVFTGTLSVGRIEGPLLGRVALVDVRLVDPSGQLIGEVARAEATWELRPLLSRSVVVPAVRLEGVDVRARIEQDGGFNLGRLIRALGPPNPEPGLPWAVSLPSVELAGAGFTLRDARNADARLVVVDSLDASGYFELDAAGRIVTGLRTLDAGIAPPIALDARFALAIRALEVTIQGEELNLEVASVALDDTGLTDLAAFADLGGNGIFRRVSMQLPTLHLDPAGVAAVVPGLNLRQALTFSATLDGPPSNVALTAGLLGPVGKIQAIASLDLTEPTTPGYRLSVDLLNVEPETWLLDVPVDSHLNGRIALEGRAITPAQAVLGLDIRLAGSRVGEVEFNAAEASLRFSDEALSLESLRVAAAGAEVEMHGTATLRGDLDVELAVDAPDLSQLETLHPALAGLGGSVDVRGRIAGAVPLDEWAALPAEPIGLLTWLSARVSADVDASAAGVVGPGVRVGAATLDLSTERSAVAHADLGASVSGLELGAVRLADAELRAGLRDQTLTATARVREAGAGRSARVAVSAVRAGSALEIGLSELQVEAPGLALRSASRPRITVELDANSHPSSVRSTPVELILNGAGLTVVGSWSAPETLDVSVDVEALPIGRLAAALGVELPIDGVIGARGSMAGTLSEPRFELTFGLSDAAWRTIDSLAVGGVASYRDQRLNLLIDVDRAGGPLLRLRAPAAGIPLDLDLATPRIGMVPTRPINATVELVPVEIAPWVEAIGGLESLELGGVVALGLAVTGTPRALEGLGAIRLEGVGATLPIGQGELWRLDGVDGEIAADYGSKTESVATLRGGLRRDGAQVASFHAESGLDVRRVMEGEVDLATWLTELSGVVRAEVGPLAVDDVPAALLRGTGLSDGELSGSLAWQGTGRSGSGDAVLRASRLRVGLYPPVSGVVELQSAASTRFDARLTLGELAPVDPWWGVAAFSDTPASSLAVDPSTAAVRVHGELGQSLRELVLAGVDPTAEMTARGQLVGLPLALLSGLAGSAAEQAASLLSGYARGWVDVWGPLWSPQFSGRVALRDVALLDGGLGTVGIEVQGDVGNVRVQVETCGSEGRTAQASVEASVPRAVIDAELRVHPPDPRSVLLSGRVVADGTPLSTLLPAFVAGSWLEEVEGRITLDAQLAGTMADPRVEGRAAVDEVKLSVIPLGRTFEDVRAGVAFSNDAIRVDSLEVRDGAGRLTGNASIELDGLAPSRISARMRFRDFFVSDPSGNGLFVDGRLEVAGAVEQGVLASEVVLRDMTLTVPDQAPPTSGPVAPPGEVLIVGEDVDAAEVGRRDPARLGDEDSEASTSSASMIPLIDVRVRTVGRNRVEQSLAEVDFEVDLLARVRPSATSLEGRVQLPRGTVTFAGKPFEITRGLIAFNGQPNDFDALVDVQAQHFLSSSVSARLASPAGDRASVSVVVNGLLSELLASRGDAIQMQSDPEMSKQDILFVLLTGRPRSDETDVGAEQQALATAGSLLLGLLGDRLTGTGVPIDTLRIEGDSQTGQAVARVEGGKYISEDVYVSGSYINSQDPEENDFEFALEWIIARFSRASIRTELRAGNRAKGGLELLYQFTRAGRRRVPAETTGGQSGQGMEPEAASAGSGADGVAGEGSAPVGP